MNKKDTEISQTTDTACKPHPSVSALLSWYERNKRDLPWRRDPSPYSVWISEIMLQQTRTEAAKGYYLRFLQRLPDVRSLAEADEDTCLKLWEGLGYYSRIRNMHKAAAVIEAQFHGKIPDDEKNLLSLPGIGNYTASAILSIAYGKPYPAVDGNLLRVFSRVTREEREIDRIPVKKDCFRYFQSLMEELPENVSPGTFNQALMDLGAMICLGGGEPKCGECPWKDFCSAHEAGLETLYPKKKEKKKRRTEEKTVLLIHFQESILLDRRPETGLLADLFEFPNLPGKISRKEAVKYAEGKGFHILKILPLPAAKHIFSHVEWHMQGFELFADEWNEFEVRKPEGQKLFLAKPEELESVWAIPSAFDVYRNHILKKK
ncbi:MAG: A/G-specific adenine glycosylase [Eubacteriales bacterium]|nr:A/G-specific adenine glycosylase [Eubacteriales bacterium]